jgi:hypothetical protein
MKITKNNLSEAIFLVEGWEEDIFGVASILENAINSMIAPKGLPKISDDNSITEEHPCIFIMFPKAKRVEFIFIYNLTRSTGTIYLDTKNKYADLVDGSTIVIRVPNNITSEKIVSKIKKEFKEPESAIEYNVWFCGDESQQNWERLVHNQHDYSTWISLSES